MKVNLTFEYPSKGHGSKTAYNNFIKGLKMNNVKVDTNSLSKGFDLTHALIPGPVSFVQRFIRKKPLIYALLFHPVEELKPFTAGRLMRAVSDYYVRKSRVVTTCSKFGKEELEKSISKPISVISCGVDVSAFKRDEHKRRAFRKKYGIGKDELLVYNIGWLARKKGLDEFIKMAKIFKDVKFLWAGRNAFPLKKKYDVTHLAKKCNNVIFTGFVEDISMVHSAGDIMLFPSYFELQGVVLLEAMASRNPIVVRDIRVFDDWLMHNSNCLKASKTNDFKNCLREIISSKRLLTKLSRNGYKTVLEHDLKNVGKKLKRVYELAIAGDFKLINDDYSYRNI